MLPAKRARGRPVKPNREKKLEAPRLYLAVERTSLSKESILVDFCVERNVYVIVNENYVDFVDPIEEYTLAHYVNKL